MSHGYGVPIGICNCATAQALVRGYHWELGTDAPVLVLILLSEEFNALINLNVLLATDVRGLEIVITHASNCDFNKVYSDCNNANFSASFSSFCGIAN